MSWRPQLRRSTAELHNSTRGGGQPQPGDGRARKALPTRRGWPSWKSRNTLLPEPFNLCGRLFLLGVPERFGPPVMFWRVSAAEFACLRGVAFVAWRCLLGHPCRGHLRPARRGFPFGDAAARLADCRFVALRCVLGFFSLSPQRRPHESCLVVFGTYRGVSSSTGRPIGWCRPDRQRSRPCRVFVRSR